MSFLTAILVILILSLGISYRFEKKFEYILPLAMASTSLLMYMGSFFEQRSIGLWLIVIASIISATYLIYRIIRGHRQINRIFRSSGFIYFLLIIILICVIIRGFVFSTWDEFSHWGLILKNMYLTNNFGNLDNSTTLFKFYPPSISLFLNFATSFSKHFSESSALGGILALSYAQLAIIFTKVKHNDWKKILLITGIIIVTPLVFFDGFYNTIYVDAVMALIFANILYFNLSYRKKDIFYAIYMSLQFYLLVNTKQIGIGLAVIAFGAILIDFIASNKIKSIRSFIKRERKNLIYIFLPLLTGAISYISWKIYIGSHDIGEGVFSLTLSKFLNLFGPNAPSYRILTIDNFIHHFFIIKQYGVIFLSSFLWSIIIFFVLYCAYKMTIFCRQKTFLFQASTILGLYLYSGIILLMYLTAFSQYESTNLASIDRYLGTYLLCMLVLTIFILINYFTKSTLGRLSQNIKIAFLFVLLLCIIPIDSFIDNTILQTSSNNSRRAIRLPYEAVEQYSSLLNPKKDKVYVISQDSNGLDYYILRYDLTPVRIQNQPIKPLTDVAWSLGSPYSANDLWTVNASPEEWSNSLNNFTYVYLYKIDSQFINSYGQLFDSVSVIKDKTMYRIYKTNDKIVLKPVTAQDINGQR